MKEAPSRSQFMGLASLLPPIGMLEKNRGLELGFDQLCVIPVRHASRPRFTNHNKIMMNLGEYCTDFNKNDNFCVPVNGIYSIVATRKVQYIPHMQNYMRFLLLWSRFQIYIVNVYSFSHFCCRYAVFHTDDPAAVVLTIKLDFFFFFVEFCFAVDFQQFRQLN